MIGRVIRVIIGFVLACLAAGLTLVLFVYTPGEFASQASDIVSDRATEAWVLTLAAATQAAVFAAPFALIATVIGESRQIGSWTYYVLVGIAIAVVGFLAQHASEAAGQASILNNYALSAFLATGFVGGFVYWLFAGRYAAGPTPPAKPEIKRPPAAAPPPSTTGPTVANKA